MAKETAQELAQESTNIVMEHVAANVNNALKGTDIKASDMAAVLDRLFETGKESAAAFSIMALPLAGKGITDGQAGVNAGRRRIALIDRSGYDQGGGKPGR